MDTVRIGVLSHAHGHINTYCQVLQDCTDARLVATWDDDADRGRRAAERYGLQWRDSARAVVEDDGIDAVMIGSETNRHADLVELAAAAGKAILLQKPMATTLADCDAIIAAARNARGIFYLGMNLRHSPVHQTVHELVSTGRVGKVTTIEANEHYYGGRTYFRRWNRLRAVGGGLWVTKACHDFDVLNWLSGGRAVRVFATSSLSHYRPRPDAAEHCRDCRLKDTCPDCLDAGDPSKPRKRLWQVDEAVTGQRRDLCLWNSDKDTFDNGMALVEYDNDVRATYTVNVLAAYSTRQLTVVGTEGMVQGDMAEGRVTWRQRHGRGREVIDVRERMRSGHGGSDAGLLADFFRCCRSGDAPRSSWPEGRASVRLSLAARDSADTHRPVEIA